MIEVRDIAVKKGGRYILKDINFDLPKGNITVVIGENGAGKSTLLEALTGSNKLSEGTIYYNQQALRAWTQPALAAQRAVLSQKTIVNFPITVSQLVEMGTYAAEQPLSQQQIRSLVQVATADVGMLNFLKRDFRTLSGGEQKRILLAKCLVQLRCNAHITSTQYLFLDEPTASLDLQQQFKLLTLIRRVVQQQNISVFAVLHDINLAAQVSDKILLMKKGRLLHQGTPTDVLTRVNIRETLGIEALIQTHPILSCPYILPLGNEELINQTI